MNEGLWKRCCGHLALPVLNRILAPLVLDCVQQLGIASMDNGSMCEPDAQHQTIGGPLEPFASGALG